MEIYILRHGEAEPKSRGEAGPKKDKPDEDRKLTATGKRDVRNVVTAANKAKFRPQWILTSPLARAQETAAIAAGAFPGSTLAITDHLRPEARPAAIWKEASRDPDISRVVLVGHEPHLSHLIAYLLDVSLAIDLKKGALVRIDIESREDPPRGTLKWILTPRLANAL
jgi:phosphohistidine phosphatase